MKHKFILPAALLIFVFACNHQKHTTKTNQVNNIPPNQHRWQNAQQKTTVDPNLNPDSRPDYNPSFTITTDILHTKLDVRFDWTKRWMYGKATISAKPYFYSSSQAVLDARGMEIRRVAQLVRSANAGTTAATDTVNLKYTYDKKQLTIDLGRTYTRNENYTLFIDYISKPDEIPVGGSAAINEDKGLYFINPDGKVPGKPKQIWTQGETQSNSVWMPTVDHPDERMTDEIYMTVDSQYVTLSNGVMTDSHKNADGTRTDHWKMDLPHPPYLVMMAVGNFAIVHDHWKNIPVDYYIEPQFEKYARMTFGQTPAMIDFFSKKLGVDFAWPKYAQICARDYVSGAMENTTATLHGDFVQRDSSEYLDQTYEDYISHELFHQWFGDLVTCESWSNLPLNESFATYGEYLWNEFRHGKDYADYGHYNSLKGYLAEANAGNLNPNYPGVREPLIRFYYEDREDMFDGHSYNKGGQVLHLLRQYVGDDAFFASLKLYLETKKFQPAEVEDLRLAFEKTTGQDLHWFFDEWFMSPGHPELDITYNYNDATHKQMVIIKQTQDRKNGTPVFRIPLSIDIYQGGNCDRKDVIVKSACDTFYFDVPAKPDLVNVDAQKTLPCYKVDHHTADEWAFMYTHAKCYVDKVEAIKGLVPKMLPADQDRTSLASKILTSALDDNFWAIRKLACDKFGPNANAVKDKLIALSKSDSTSDVRSAAIDALSEGATGDDLKAVYLAALNDKAYSVITSALEALVTHFPDAGMDEAKKREGSTARMMKLAVGNAYVHGGGDAQQKWFSQTLNTLYGQQQNQFILQYIAFMKRCSDETVQKALPDFENLYNTTDAPGVKLYVKGGLSGLTYYYKQKADDAQKKIDDLKSTKKDATGLQKLQSDKDAATQMMNTVSALHDKLK